MRILFDSRQDAVDFVDEVCEKLSGELYIQGSKYILDTPGVVLTCVDNTVAVELSSADFITQMQFVGVLLERWRVP